MFVPKKVSHASEEQQQYLCPTCGILYTRNDVKLTSEYRERREKSRKEGDAPPARITNIWYGKVKAETTIPIKRRFNPLKVLFLFGGSFLNGPSKKYELSTAYETARQNAIDSWHAFGKRIFALTAVMGKASLKYPYLSNLEAWIELLEDFSLGLRFITKEMRSGVDDRYEKTWSQWLHIIKYAEEAGAEAAAKEFYGMTPEGRKTFLAPRYIKKKRIEVAQFAAELLECLPKFFYSVSVIDYVISNTPELKQEYERLSKEYDESGGSWEKITLNLLEKDGKEESNNHKQRHYTYSYYKIRHYDHQLYEKRKLEYKNGTRKSIGDVRRECRVKESELPPEVISYVKSKSSK